MSIPLSIIGLNEEWEAAVALYQGELFPGDRYADWAAALREWLMQCSLRAALAAARQFYRSLF